MALMFDLLTMIIRSSVIMMLLLLSNHAIHGQGDCGVRTLLTTPTNDRHVSRYFSTNEWNRTTGQWHRMRLPLPPEYKIFSLAFSADRNWVITAGRPSYDNDFNEEVIVFHRAFVNGTQNWEIIGDPITHPTIFLHVDFSTALSISDNGSTIAIGEFSYSNNRGHVRIFEMTSKAKNWVQVGPAIIGNAEQTGFGASIDFSADGNTLVVGEEFLYGEDLWEKPYWWKDGWRPNGTEAHVYQRINESPTGVQWNPMGSSITGRKDEQYFGRKVVISASGTIIAVAAKRRIVPYKFDAALKQWKQMGSDLRHVFMSSHSLTMSADGTTLVFSHDELNIYGGTSGWVSAYAWGANQWKKLAIGEIPTDYFGAARISADGNTLSVVASSTTTLFELNKNCNVITCDPTWNFYNSDTDTLFYTLDSLLPVTVIRKSKENRTTIVKRSNATNIEGIFPCGVGNDTSVLMEVQKIDQKGIPRIYYSRHVKPVNGRYFLYGAGSGGIRNLPNINIFPGYMPVGIYTIRARVGGKYTSRTRFNIVTW